MVALKTYRPNDLNVNPFAIATELSKPYDYDGVLNQIQEWNKLANNEAIADQNEITAAQKQDQFDLKKKKDQEFQDRVEAGEDPESIRITDVLAKTGDYDSFRKAMSEQKKAEQDSQDRNLKVQSTLNNIAKSNPEYAAKLAGEMGIGDFRAPAQKSKDGKVKEPKKDKPQLLINPKTGESKVTGADDGFLPVELVQKAQGMGIDLSGGADAPAPEESVGAFEKFMRALNGDGNKAVTPGNSKPPPAGFEYTGKVDAQGRKGIRKIQ